MLPGECVIEPVTDAGREAVEAARRLAPFLSEQAAANDAAGRFAAESMARLRDEGVLAVSAPPAAGGLGLTSLHDVSLLVKQLASADGSVGVAVSMHLALAVYFARTVETAEPGSRPAQEQWLDQIGRRLMVLGSAVAEPGAEAWRPTTTACPAGDGWVISGTKILVSNSPAATHFYTRLRAERDGGYEMATAMIRADAPGVTVLDDWRGLGLRGSGSGAVRFADVAVPAGLVRAGGRWGTPDPTDFEGRAAASIPIVAAYLGMAEAARDTALTEFAKGRSSPSARGRSDAVVTQWQMAELTIALAEATAVFRDALVRIDDMFRSTAPRRADVTVGRSLLRDCLIASIVVERSANRVIDAAMQICGGRSYTAGHPLERGYRDVKAAAFMRPFSPPERFVEFLLPDSVEA
ncbi:Acyl-CoA dehydrogenase [Actinoplanes derwentensis]|uniref:Acyl-CoA dehydrogenase n=1 Tax=Actinoplanes derwentensis TaxID=113562 RepID=A0A1H2DCZ4_9ACTN|nr:acyl-CoA dehydrogenase [Actinoplanes derwentensis]SDT80603.1 Acyl-CoA dehydrogenase [Actinoplanes derwentensis]